MRSRIGWVWVEHELEAWPGGGTLSEPCWRAQVPGLRYVDGALVVIQVAWFVSRWLVSDCGGAFASSRSATGVKGFVMGRLEDFFDVQMTGDCHFYVEVAALPKRTAVDRIERAAMTLATYSALVAAARTPANWPPSLTIVLTPEQAWTHGFSSAARS